MGCDIHAYAEIKLEGLWYCYSKLIITRDYQLFSRMAGVRDDPRDSFGPISPPRGLPRNPSTVVIFENETTGSDGHDHSWLTCKEVADLEEWNQAFRRRNDWEKIFGYICGNGWDLAEYPEEYPKRLSDARLVFWFDN